MHPSEDAAGLVMKLQSHRGNLTSLPVDRVYTDSRLSQTTYLMSTTRHCRHGNASAPLCLTHIHQP